MAYLLADEGNRFTNDPDDSGGATKWGVTLAMWAQFTGHPVAPADIEALTLFQIKPFYEIEFWQPLGCDRLTDAGISIAVFDAGVLFGVSAVSYIAQQACNLSGGKLNVDGVIGSASVACLNQMSRLLFLASFHMLLMQRIENIIDKNPKDEKFREGWVNRADRLLTLDTNTVFNIAFT